MSGESRVVSLQTVITQVQQEKRGRTVQQERKDLKKTVVNRAECCEKHVIQKRKSKHHDSTTEVRNYLIRGLVEGWGQGGKQRFCVDFSFKKLYCIGCGL